MCSLNHLLLSPFSFGNLKYKPLSKDLFDKKKQDEVYYPDEDAIRYHKNRYAFKNFINDLENKHRDMMFLQKLKHQYPVLQNRNLPNHQRRYFLSLLEQNHPRLGVYQSQHMPYPNLNSLVLKKNKSKQSAMQSNKDNLNQAHSNPFLKPIFKLSSNFIKRIFPLKFLGG